MKYFPILLSKPSELVALEQLSLNVKNETIPILEILNESIDDGNGTYSEKLEEALTNIWSFDGNSIYLDFSLFEDIDGSIPLIETLFTNLINNGVNAKLASVMISRGTLANGCK